MTLSATTLQASRPVEFDKDRHKTTVVSHGDTSKKETNVAEDIIYYDLIEKLEDIGGR